MTTEPRTLISPRFPAEKLEKPTIDDLIDIFEDRMLGWLLRPAENLMQDPIEQVAGFALSLSYFEGIWIYITGLDSKNRSKEYFRRGFVDVFTGGMFPDALLERIAAVLYEDGRCGFFHDAMLRTRLFFGGFHKGTFAITLPKENGVTDQAGEIASIVIDPAEYVKFLIGHLEKYVKRLRDTSEADLRRKFQDACKLKWNYEGDPVVIALA